MYGEDVLMDCGTHHGELLIKIEATAGILETYLIEQPFPQNHLSHVSFYFTNRFHKSLLALRLLLDSGYLNEACSVLRMMVEYTVTLRFIANQPDPRASLFIEEVHLIPQHPEFGMHAMAEDTQLLDWYHSIYQPYSSSIIPHLSRELDELFNSSLPDACDAWKLMDLSCELAIVFVECIQSLS